MRLVKFIGFIGLTGLIGLISPVGVINSAGPAELILTWKANNYTPLSYLGKALPSRGAVVVFAVQMIENDKLIDLSNKEIRWYVDDGLIRSGVGLTGFAHTVALYNGDSISVRIVVVDNERGDINKFLTLPIVKPEAVIDAAQLPQLKPLFYFFNIASPDELQSEWDDAGSFIKLKALNPNNPLEFANAFIKKP